MLIRDETAQDMHQVREVYCAAFETDAEANLVEVLHQEKASIISLVAEANGKIIGHVLFSPVKLAEGPSFNLLGLAPMAVRPHHQRTGVGTELVKAGLQSCKKLGCDAVVVLGHPEYYLKFGFVPSIKYGIISDYEVPDEAFMILELKEGSLQAAKGTIQYHQVFRSL